ncbi:MAG: hypothetical protein SFY67_02605 [Candidatus Melainabacteria bacterium]|nr:hypothetical protein [Candidatus Melainabacteria bacterium]
MNRLQLSCRRIAIKIGRSRLAAILSEKVDDLQADFRITFLKIANPEALSYDSRAEDRMLRSLEKIRNELIESVILVREMMQINMREIDQIDQKILTVNKISEKQKLENFLAKKSDFVSKLRAMLIELEYKDSDFYLKSQVLRSKIKSSITIGNANYAINKIQWDKLRSALNETERAVQERERNAGRLISEEELKQKELILEDAQEELELIQQLLEKMDIFIKASEIV